MQNYNYKIILTEKLQSYKKNIKMKRGNIYTINTDNRIVNCNVNFNLDLDQIINEKMQ